VTAATRSRHSLADRAYALLEERLVTLQLQPGMAVQEKDLAEAIGLGRTPVREAIQRLAGESLLTVIPRKGLLVSPVLRSELAQIVEVRRVLERLLVVKAAERASPDQRRALQALAAHIDRVAAAPDVFFRLDRRLDELLGVACGNRHLVRALAPMHAHCRRLWYLNRERLELEAATELHAALARAVAAGEGAGAVRALNGIIAVLETLVRELDSLS
jgi:DNA-binding GntR family transcriptional regulator